MTAPQKILPSDGTGLCKTAHSSVNVFFTEPPPNVSCYHGGITYFSRNVRNHTGLPPRCGFTVETPHGAS